MAVSGTISATTFNTNKVIDSAFRACRLRAQAITPEMQSYARDALYLFLSSLANGKTPSWCQQRQIYPLYQGQYQVTLDTGTVEVLNANLRILQELVPTSVVSLSTSYKAAFDSYDGSAAIVSTVGIKWAGAAVALTFQVSDDDVNWTTVGTQTTSAAAAQWTWTDIVPALAHQYFRITSTDPMSLTEVYLGTMPQEVPMGVLNRDTYVAQSNKTFTGRPLTYWLQRDQVRPVMNLWPAPDAASEHHQLIVWRHRHVMDVGAQSGDIEVPQRWMDAIIAGVAARLAAQTPEVDINLLPRLDQAAAMLLQAAREGDNSGASSFIVPRIGCYTR